MFGHLGIADPLPVQVCSLGGTRGNRGRQTCFCTTVDPRRTHDVLYQVARPESRSTRKVGHQHWEKMQVVRAHTRLAQGELGATSLVFVPRVDTQTHGVLRKKTDQQDGRQKMIVTLLRTIFPIPTRKNRLGNWRKVDTKTILTSEEDKEKINLQGNTERFELFVLSETLHLAICFVDAVLFSQRSTKVQKHLQSLVK